MRILTLTTDFGTLDHYAARLKGQLLTAHAALNIIDLTHRIPAHDMVKGAYVLRHSYQSFPKGTIHVVSINNFYSQNNAFLAVRHNGHYFLGADNGLFSLLFDGQPKEAYELPIDSSDTFAFGKAFAKAVKHIVGRVAFAKIGKKVDLITERITFRPVIKRDHISGSVIHVDGYENVITNISQKLFEEAGEGKDFELLFKRHEPITKLSWQYQDVPIGDILCLFNAAGYLEIAINMGKAASMLGLHEEDVVMINFG